MEEEEQRGEAGVAWAKGTHTWALKVLQQALHVQVHENKDVAELAVGDAAHDARVHFGSHHLPGRTCRSMVLRTAGRAHQPSALAPGQLPHMEMELVSKKGI